jgi:hypothetical protein
MQTQLIERRIQRAALLTGTGLMFHVLTLLGIHPLAFVAFLAVGCPLIAAGVGLYLWSLVTPGKEARKAAAASSSVLPV